MVRITVAIVHDHYRFLQSLETSQQYACMFCHGLPKHGCPIDVREPTSRPLHSIGIELETVYNEVIRSEAEVDHKGQMVAAGFLQDPDLGYCIDDLI